MNKAHIMLIFLFLLAVNIGYADTKDTNALVFWEPSKQMTLDQLHIDVSNNVSFQTLQARYKIAAVLPLESIDTFYWDEQIFTLKNTKKITDIIYNIRMAANTDNTLIPFFSIIIDNKLIASGINRLQLLSSAQEKMYDTIGNSSFFTGRYVYHQNKIYFRFTPTLKALPELSIYERESAEDIARIMIKELYYWLYDRNTIVHGYFDIYEMLTSGKIVPVKEHEKIKNGQTRYYGTPVEPIEAIQ